jgi:hypothetical protein
MSGALAGFNASDQAGPAGRAWPVAWIDVARLDPSLADVEPEGMFVGKTRDEVHDKWTALYEKAKQGPVATKVPTLGTYLEYWLKDVVKPGMKPRPAETHEMHVRLYVSQDLKKLRLDKIRVPQIRTWLNKLTVTCQCCAQGKDERREPKRRRCCAIGRCCDQRLSRTSIESTRAVLRRAFNNAIADELISKNLVALVRVPSPAARRKRKVRPWSVEEVGSSNQLRRTATRCTRHTFSC